MKPTVSEVFILSVSGLLALGCAGGGTPEETVETFHGHMAARGFERAAVMVYYEAWAGAPEAELNAAREAYADTLVRQYEEEDLDYGRAEITDRVKVAAGVVDLTVSYRLRSRPSAPPVLRRVTTKIIGGAWHLVPPADEDGNAGGVISP